MHRPALLAMIAATLVAGGHSALAAAKEVDIKRRFGGDIHHHVNEATAMMATGRTYRVIGDQYSAAAMQVLFIKSQFPDRICATKGARLHFHLGLYYQTNEKMKEPDWMFIHFIRPENLEKLGKLPEFGKGFKTVKASDYLGLCKPRKK